MAMDLVWDERYKIGNKEIDAEHKNMFKLAQKAFKIVDLSKKKEKIHHILIELREYVITHFENEEKYMASIGYPALNQQVKMHVWIIEDLNKFMREMPNKTSTQIEKELAAKLYNWITKHILNEDAKIMEWHRQNPKK